MSFTNVELTVLIFMCNNLELKLFAIQSSHNTTPPHIYISARNSREYMEELTTGMTLINTNIYMYINLFSRYTKTDTSDT